MLTPNDDRHDGDKLAYLKNPTMWRHHDPALFDAISKVDQGILPRDVSAVEHANLFTAGCYDSECVPDNTSERAAWFAAALHKLQSCDLLFFDPDNGIEVASVPKGHRKSSKYVYWDELASAWRTGKSLLLFQHFAREKRSTHIQQLSAALAEQSPDSIIEAWTSANVLFLFACQQGHAEMADAARQLIQKRRGARLESWRPGSNR
jgi:hypothetical protein